MIRDDNGIVKLKSRKPHPLDIPFIQAGLTQREKRDNPPTEDDLKEFRKTSTFTGRNLIPSLHPQWFAPVFIAGATKSGKSYLVDTMLLRDKRPVYYVSDLLGNDPSLKWIRRTGRLRPIQHPLEMSSMQNSVILFDDARDEDMLDWMEKLFQQGRHHKISVICIKHMIRGQKNMRLMMDAEWLVFFPRSNKTQILRYLKDIHDMPAGQRRMLVNHAAKDGRYLFIHQWAPNIFVTSKSVIPF